MRNQRNNFIPLPTRPAKSTPKPLLRTFYPRKCSSSQTEKVVLIKEENISFTSATKLGHNDAGMRRDYVKAVNYINSCHKFINAIIEKNNPDTSNLFFLPMVTNFIPLFPYLASKKKKETKKTEDGDGKGQESRAPISTEKKSEGRKSKSNFGVKKTIHTYPEEVEFNNAIPAGDGEKSVAPSKSDENKYADQVADVIKEQLQQFLATFQDDMQKSNKKIKKESSKHKCKNVDIVKHKLEELSKLYHTQRSMQSSSQIVQTMPLPEPPPPDFPYLKSKDFLEECSVILSDTDCDEVRPRKKSHFKISHYYQGSATSLMSDSSDIKSDSEINVL